MMLRWTKPGIGESIVDVVLSISRLNDERFGDSTALANYSLGQATLNTPDAIAYKLEEIRKEISDIPGYEGTYLRAMNRGFECYTRILQGDEVPYREAIRNIQEIELKPIPEQHYEMLAEKIRKQLRDFGYLGTTGQQVTAWLKDTRIDPDQVAHTAEAFIGKAKQATLERVTKLPEKDKVDAVNSIRGVFWSGYSKYNGNFCGSLTFNIDRPWSTPTFANILCHEGYPGHQTFYCHWDDLFLQGKLPLEGAYYAVNSPTNCMFEGAPETGVHFLGWDDAEEDTPEISDKLKQQLVAGRDVLDLQRMLQTQACYLVNVEGMSKEQAVAFMLSTGIYNQTEAENTYRFFSHPVQQYYYPSYYYGHWMIHDAYDLIPESKRGEFFHNLYDMPHTNSTFIEMVSGMTGNQFDPFANH